MAHLRHRPMELPIRTTEAADPATDPSPVTPPPAAGAPSHPWRKWLLLAGAVAGLAVGGYFLVPSVETALNTVSTDDAYVNGHVTFVAPRVAGQVSRVLVDDNYRVKKGDLLVQLDKEPYQVQVEIKKAAVVSGRGRPGGRRGPGPRPGGAGPQPSAGSSRRHRGGRQPGRQLRAAAWRPCKSKEATLDLRAGQPQARPRSSSPSGGDQQGGVRPAPRRPSQGRRGRRRAGPRGGLRRPGSASACRRSPEKGTT